MASEKAGGLLPHTIARFEAHPQAIAWTLQTSKKRRALDTAHRSKPDLEMVPSSPFEDSRSASVGRAPPASDQRHHIPLTTPFCLADGTHCFPAFVEEHCHAIDGMNYVHRASLFIVADVFAKHTELYSGGLIHTSKDTRGSVNGGRLCRPHTSPAPRTQCNAIGELQTVATTRS